MPKVQLEILGLSFSQTQDNAYVLILVEHNGERRIPIIIGGAEAQAIAIQLENLQAPRPLTHDLFLSLAKSFSIDMREVIIHTLKEGIFYSKIVCVQGDSVVEIDSRTSDAVALAVRFACPIYTTSEVIAKAGIVLEIEKEISTEPENTNFADIKNISYEDFTTKELQEKLEEAVNNEDYEKASEIRDELKKRGGSN
jgi:bifunctional DNase/RNase